MLERINVSCSRGMTVLEREDLWVEKGKAFNQGGYRKFKKFDQTGGRVATLRLLKHVMLLACKSRAGRSAISVHSLQLVG